MSDPARRFSYLASLKKNWHEAFENVVGPALLGCGCTTVACVFVGWVAYVLAVYFAYLASQLGE